MSQREIEAMLGVSVIDVRLLAPQVAAFNREGGTWVVKRLHPRLDTVLVSEMLHAQWPTQDSRIVESAGSHYVLVPFVQDRAAPEEIPTADALVTAILKMHCLRLNGGDRIEGRSRWFDILSLHQGLASRCTAACRNTTQAFKPSLSRASALSRDVIEFRRQYDRRSIYCHGDIRRSNLILDSSGWHLIDVDGYVAMPPEYDLQRATWGLALTSDEPLENGWLQELIRCYESTTRTAISCRLMEAIFHADILAASAWLALGIDAGSLTGRTYLNDLRRLNELAHSKVLAKQFLVAQSTYCER